MKVSAAVKAVSPNSRSASSGRTVRSWPIMPPTRALTRRAGRTGPGSGAARAARRAGGVGGRWHQAGCEVDAGGGAPVVGSAERAPTGRWPAALEQAGAGHGPLAVAAHHRDRPGGDAAGRRGRRARRGRRRGGARRPTRCPGGRRAPSAIVAARRAGWTPIGRPARAQASMPPSSSPRIASWPIGEALADQVGSVGVVVEDEHDGPVEVDEPAEPAGEPRPVLDRHRPRVCRGERRRSGGRRRARRRRRGARTVSRSSEARSGHLPGRGRAAPVRSRRAGGSRREAAQPVESASTKRSSSSMRSSGLVARSWPMVVVRRAGRRRAERPGTVGGVHGQVVGQGEDLRSQRPEQLAGELLAVARRRAGRCGRPRRPSATHPRTAPPGRPSSTSR